VPFKLVNDASQFVGPTILNLLLAVVAGEALSSTSAYKLVSLVLPGFSDLDPIGGGPAAGVIVGAAGAALPARSLLGADGPQGWASAAAAWWAALDGRGKGYVLAAALFLGTVSGTLADAQHFHATQRAGFRWGEARAGRSLFSFCKCLVQ
jgi:hypothetical protein